MFFVGISYSSVLSSNCYEMWIKVIFAQSKCVKFCPCRTLHVSRRDSEITLSISFFLLALCASLFLPFHPPCLQLHSIPESLLVFDGSSAHRHCLQFWSSLAGSMALVMYYSRPSWSAIEQLPYHTWMQLENMLSILQQSVDFLQHP